MDEEKLERLRDWVIVYGATAACRRAEAFNQLRLSGFKSFSGKRKEIGEPAALAQHLEPVYLPISVRGKPLHLQLVDVDYEAIQSSKLSDRQYHGDQWLEDGVYG